MSKEDEIAEAMAAAARAEAEKDEAEAAATAVAAANAAAALAKEESAVAQQRAAADMKENQEENKWLKETVSNLHKNSEAQGQALVETRQMLQSLSETASGIVQALTRAKSTRTREQDKTETPANPEKEAAREEEENRAGKNLPPPEPKKQTRRWI